MWLLLWMWRYPFINNLKKNIVHNVRHKILKECLFQNWLWKGKTIKLIFKASKHKVNNGQLRKREEDDKCLCVCPCVHVGVVFPFRPTDASCSFWRQSLALFPRLTQLLVSAMTHWLNKSSSCSSNESTIYDLSMSVIVFLITNSFAMCFSVVFSFSCISLILSSSVCNLFILTGARFDLTDMCYTEHSCVFAPSALL